MIILGTNSIKDTGYDVANSLRQNRADSSFLSKTFSGDGTHHDKGTISVWVKRSETGAEAMIYSAGASGREFIRFETNDTLTYRSLDEGFHLNTNRVFRDISAWYHIVVAFDSSQGTASNRQKIYVNGVQETSFATETYQPNQNTDHKILAAELQRLGKDSEQNGPYANCYYCEVVGIDGQQLAADQFGEFDEDSAIWKPIKVSGLTFGTNGFHLDFEDSSALGTDVSGNGNDFANTNFAATDQSTDTCTNNFATFNPLIKPAAAITLSEGNLKGVFPGSWTALPATFGLTKGKWYFEAKNITSGQNAFIGVVSENQDWDDSTPYNETTGVVLYGPGGRKTVDNTSNDGFFATLSSGQIVGVALDLDSGTKTIQFSVNGTDTPNSTPVDLPSTFDDVFIFPYFIGNSSSATSNWELNFGSPPYSESGGNSDGNDYGNFKTAPPSGYFALNTKNLAEYG